MKLPDMRAALSALREREGDAALRRAVRFFAAMLVLTLAAQGAAQAALPTVTLTGPARGVVRVEAAAEGTVRAAAREVQAAPEGAVVQSLLVQEGERVQAGQRIAQFDEAQTQQAARQANAQLALLRTQRDALLQTDAADASQAAAAQTALDWAYEDVRGAQAVLDAAQAADPPDEAAVQSAQEALEAANRAALQAQQARDAAIAAYHDAQDAAARAERENAAQAGVLALQIEALEVQLAALEALADDGYALCAQADGTLLTWSLAPGQAAQGEACTLATAAGGYVFEAALYGEDAQLAQAGAAATVSQEHSGEVQASVDTVRALEDGGVQVTARLPDAQWREGAASARITLSEAEYAMCLPAQAVRQDAQGTFVYAARERQTVLGAQTVLERMAVQVEARGADTVAVTGSVAPGDRIVTGASKALSEGARVRVEE